MCGRMGREILALAKWNRDRQRNLNLGMIKTKYDWNRQITPDMLFKYSAH
jgi:hypothetical protein